MAQAFSINSVIFRKTLAAGRKETNTLIFRCLAGTVFLGIEFSVLLFYCRNHNGNRWLLTSRIFGLTDDADQALLALWANERGRKLIQPRIRQQGYSSADTVTLVDLTLFEHKTEK